MIVFNIILLLEMLVVSSIIMAIVMSAWLF